MAEMILPGQLTRLVRRITSRRGAEADTTSDEALAARVRATGDTEAFASLVTRYRSRLVALARRMLAEKYGDMSEAEDVAQEAFIAAYDKRNTYRPGDLYRPWLYRIALNRCLDRLRAQGRRLRPQTLDGAAPEVMTLIPGPLPALLAGEREARIQEAVAALPPSYRAVFLLRTLDDLSYEEIAVASGLPLGTVKTHLFRARTLLREALKDYWNI